MTNDNVSLSHTKWSCKYHIVFAPKYRRQEIYGRIKADIGKILRQGMLYSIKKGNQSQRSNRLYCIQETKIMIWQHEYEG